MTQLVASKSALAVSQANSSWQDNFIQKFKNVDIQILENGQQRVLQKTNNKTIHDISKQRQSKLEHEETLVGSFAFRFDDSVDFS